jgi:hypothetical protein
VDVDGAGLGGGGGVKCSISVCNASHESYAVLWIRIRSALEHIGIKLFEIRTRLFDIMLSTDYSVWYFTVFFKGVKFVVDYLKIVCTYIFIKSSDMDPNPVASA